MTRNSRKNYSIIREQEYEYLLSTILNGKILDLGGSVKSGYQELIGGEHTFLTVNINKEYGCDIVFDIEQRFPLENVSFDNIICLNVLEHVFEFQNVFDESFRVLKKGGKMVIATPFLFHIHGSPDDYFRYTRSALEKALKKAGFTDVSIEELGFQACSLNFQLFGGSFPAFLRRPLKRVAIFLDGLLSKIIPRYFAMRKRIPLGYFTIAQK